MIYNIHNILLRLELKLVQVLDYDRQQSCIANLICQDDNKVLSSRIDSWRRGSFIVLAHWGRNGCSYHSTHMTDILAGLFVKLFWG